MPTKRLAGIFELLYFVRLTITLEKLLITALNLALNNISGTLR